jgi:SAM-dependent methyltransferase
MKNLASAWDKRALSLKWTPEYKSQIFTLEDPVIKFLTDSEEYKRAQNKRVKLLDAGSGVGQYVYIAKKLGFDSIGVDFSKKSVEIAKKLGNKVRFGDMRKIPFKSNTFDVVVAGGSIEHFPETEEALKEINRVLKPSGLFLGNVPHKFGIYTLSRKVQQSLGIWKAGYEKSFSYPEFRMLIKNSGFSNLEIVKMRVRVGRHRFISGILKILDEPLFLLGLGGAHFYFSCRKRLC